jgi:hypothetical protein
MVRRTVRAVHLSALSALSVLCVPSVPSAFASAGPPDRLSASPPAEPLSRRAAEPSPGSDLTIAVMTMGVGGQVWERFGHNAIIVEDRSRGTSIAYNYGMFSFRQENFLLRFVQGRMNYWMGSYPTDTDLPRYVAARRSVWRQELNLLPAQRLALSRFLQNNALPENRFYRYDYYRDNCSTRVRDALDQALGGALRAQTGGPASATFRFHTQRLNSHSIPLYTGLLLAVGPGADRPITRWDEMFLPLKLREVLRDIRVPDSTGAMVPLVRSEQTLFESPAYPVPEAPPVWLPGYLLLGVTLGAAFWWGGAAGRRSAVARGVLRIGGTTFAGVTGLLGAVLIGLWGFTDHTIAARNENVLQATLFALALGVLLPAALRDRPQALRAARVLAVIVGALSLLGLALKVLPAFHQVNGQILALFVPANVGLAAGVVLWARGTREDRIVR